MWDLLLLQENDLKLENIQKAQAGNAFTFPGLSLAHGLRHSGLFFRL